MAGLVLSTASRAGDATGRCAFQTEEEIRCRRAWQCKCHGKHLVKGRRITKCCTANVIVRHVAEFNLQFLHFYALSLCLKARMHSFSGFAAA